MLADALLVIQTANTAIGAVKELLGNGKDITDCAQHLGKYFDAKAEIQKNAGNSTSTGSDLENFLHLEKLKQAEAELKDMLIYQGRANLYTDFLRYQAEQKQKREDQAEAQKKQKAEKRKRIAGFIRTVVIMVSVVLGFAAIGGFIYLLITMRQV
tara:strand:+ start:2054 stop:2518 length:465 start_codon:yes stop_codon:yes gene_type:complete